MNSLRGLIRSRTSRRLRLVACLAMGIAACGQSKPGPGRGRAAALPKTSLPAPGSAYDTPFITPGIRQPSTVPVAEATLADDARVIGVTAGGRHRAYSVQVMSGMTSHVVNDLVDDVPVSVSYCDQTDCTRVFAGRPGSSPLELSTGGWVRGEMALRYGDQQYSQTATDIPLQDHPFVVTTWKEWREQHPDTDVFVGG